jgi:prepilin-type N-terminal cleavage/methylation domain-containing protein
VPERSPLVTTVAKRAREQGGFTLIEVLIVAVLLGVVLLPIMNGLVFEGSQTPIDTSYAQAVGQETAGLQRMVQEIRQAYAIEGTNGDPSSGQGSYIDFLIMIYSASAGTDQPWEVKYDCSQVSPSNSSYHACVRFACQATAYNTPCTLPSTSRNAVVDRVLPTSPLAFTFRDRNGNPAANAQDIWTVEASVQVPAHGSLWYGRHPLSYGLTHPITLDNQTNLPNLQNGT